MIEVKRIHEDLIGKEITIVYNPKKPMKRKGILRAIKGQVYFLDVSEEKGDYTESRIHTTRFIEILR